MISVTVAVTGRDVGAPTFVNRTWTIANVTSVKGSNAVVHIVANAVTVCIYRTVSTTFTDHVVKQTRRRRGVSVVACTHVRAIVVFITEAISVRVATIGRSIEVDIVKQDVLTIAICSDHDSELKDVAIGDIGQIKKDSIEVIDEVEHFG